MFALPVALDAMVLRSPVEVLEIDALWPLVFTGPWSCDIRVGEVKSRATGTSSPGLSIAQKHCLAMLSILPGFWIVLWLCSLLSLPALTSHCTLTLDV